MNNPNINIPTNTEHAAEADPGQSLETDMIDTHISRLIANADSLEAAERLNNTYNTHGTPFALYLTLNHVNPYDDAIEAHFQRDFVGTYDGWHAYTTMGLRELGLADALDSFISTCPEARNLITWDYDAVWNRLTQHFDIVEIRHTIYAYTTEDN